MWCLVWSMYNALKVLVWVSNNLEWEKNIKDTSILFLNTIQMCQKTTKMYQLVRRQSSMESSHITDRVGGRDCNGLQAWRKKELRTKIILKNQKNYQRWNEFTQNFHMFNFFLLNFFYFDNENITNYLHFQPTRFWIYS